MDNLVYSLLDYPVALGGADDEIEIGGATLSRAELLDRVAKVAGILRALGIELGDKVTVDVPGGGPGEAIATLAAWRLGAVLADAAPTRLRRGDVPDVAAAETHGAFARGRNRRVADYLSGITVTQGEDSWDLGALARETGIQPADAPKLPESQPLWQGSRVTAADLPGSPEAPAWLRQLA